MITTIPSYCILSHPIPYHKTPQTERGHKEEKERVLQEKMQDQADLKQDKERLKEAHGRQTGAWRDR